jgi:hypothetical protein
VKVIYDVLNSRWFLVAIWCILTALLSRFTFWYFTVGSPSFIPNPGLTTGSVTARSSDKRYATFSYAYRLKGRDYRGSGPCAPQACPQVGKSVVLTYDRHDPAHSMAGDVRETGRFYAPGMSIMTGVCVMYLMFRLYWRYFWKARRPVRVDLGKVSLALYSPFDCESAIRILRGAIDEERPAWLWLSGYRGSGRVIGFFTSPTFRLFRRKWFYTGHVPYFYAHISDDPGGSRVEGYLEYSRLSRLSTDCFRCLVLFLNVVFALVYLGTLIAAKWRWSSVSDGRGMSVLPLGFLLWIFLIDRYQYWIRRRDERYLTAFLERTLRAQLERVMPV